LNLGPREPFAMRKRCLKRENKQFSRKKHGKQAGKAKAVRALGQERKLPKSESNPRRQELLQHDHELSASGTTTLPQPVEQQTDKQSRNANKEPQALVTAQFLQEALEELDSPQPAQEIEKRSAIRAVSAIGREECYRISDTTAIGVEIEKDSDGKSMKLDAELVDISQGGIRLRSKTSLAEKDSLILTIVPKGSSKSFSAHAQVCWTTIAPKGRYWIGCSIEPRIPLTLLEHLAASGILERRQDSRKDVSLTLSACWALDPTEFKVSVLNISHGGICLSIAQDGKPGDRIRLTLKGEIQKPEYVLMTVCWQVDTDEGYIIGCRFCHPTSYEKLIHLADAQDAKTMSKSSGKFKFLGR
jgi:hypothetical protein